MEKMYEKSGSFWFSMISSVWISLGGGSIGVLPLAITSVFYILGLVMLTYVAYRADVYERMYREESKDNVRLRSMLIEMKVESYRKEVR